MTTHDLIKRVRTEPENIEFSQVIDVIHHDYQYTASAFSNGDLTNKAGSNEGSCKIFYFALLNQLSEVEWAIALHSLATFHIETLFKRFTPVLATLPPYASFIVMTSIERMYPMRKVLYQIQ